MKQGERLIDILQCPNCQCRMAIDDSQGAGLLFCLGSRRHCFDLAKSGYVNFALRHAGGGDAKEAVRARTAFLSAGYYSAAAEEVCRLLRKYVPSGVVIDAGCGEGYYTNLAQASGDGAYEVCGVDLSRDAVEAASRAARREGQKTSFVVGSLFELPFADESADAIINIFAPCAEKEFLRVLKPGGILLLLGAGETHLLGMKKMIYDHPYENIGRADLPKTMTFLEKTAVQREITVNGREQIMNLFSMTPYYWRTSPSDKSRLEALETLKTEIDFDCRVYRKDG